MVFLLATENIEGAEKIGATEEP